MDSMSADELVATYLRALSTADVDLAVSLFTDVAVVHSPLYGPTEPGTFYPRLFADTSAAHGTLLATMQGHDQRGHNDQFLLSLRLAPALRSRGAL
jgi:hypothetical protein